MTVPSQTQLRKRDFAAALALAGYTVGEFARQYGVTEGHLHQVLKGRTSAPLNRAIDELIRTYLCERCTLSAPTPEESSQ